MLVRALGKVVLASGEQSMTLLPRMFVVLLNDIGLIRISGRLCTPKAISYVTGLDGTAIIAFSHEARPATGQAIHELCFFSPRGVSWLQANLKKFMEYVQTLNVDKVSRLLEKGLDPNFHDPDTGECPLTLAVQLDYSSDVIKALRNGGAHLDFRTREGMTALHKAVRCRNHAALMTLLDLGASTDYKDSRGLTPLYHSAMVGGDPYCCELLLHDYAQVGCVDENGWQEIHQACRYGHVQHLEHLLFYGADMRSQNASGNTALHVCALYNQESCARVLLFRGASKDIRNYNSQTAFQQEAVSIWVSRSLGKVQLGRLPKQQRPDPAVPAGSPLAG
ncbi:SH3 and multiple ankyrin repeat domains protein 3-like [Sphaerodactylus townsendi]|uniref:SH3 and multiple ankyrin repeat domains protein 3-like n=1 Tax=Sphaerodactylus townsendi TaxID=933632 RepID=UPI002025E0D9|nr:SH3 and multiple ankyrin repeat domains protein 3-like [Sphaerodactylus townsendi]